MSATKNQTKVVAVQSENSNKKQNKKLSEKKRKRDSKPATNKKHDANKKQKIIRISLLFGKLHGKPTGVPEGYQVEIVDVLANEKQLANRVLDFLVIQSNITSEEHYQLMNTFAGYSNVDYGMCDSTFPDDLDTEENINYICNHFDDARIVEYMTDSLKDMKSDNQIKDASLLTNALKAYIEEDDKELPSLAFFKRNMEPIYYVWGFNTTNFKKGGFQEVLRALRIPPIAKAVQDQFLWKRRETEKPYTELITAGNPITGEYPADKGDGTNRLNFAGYMGLRAPHHQQRAWALKHIRVFADHIKGESPDRLDYMNFELKRLPSTLH